jgi:hypothetical protein
MDKRTSKAGAALNQQWDKFVKLDCWHVGHGLYYHIYSIFSGSTSIVNSTPDGTRTTGVTARSS